MQKGHSWRELLLESDDASLAALDEVSAACIHHEGASGAFLDEVAKTDSLDDHPVCSACGHKVVLRVFFPASEKSVEEVLACAERVTREVKSVYRDFDVRILGVHTVEHKDWSQSWKGYFGPLPIGKRILVVPPWYVPEIHAHSDPEIIRIVIEPGMAFGTGQHPSTVLCVECIESIAQEHPWMLRSFLDVGCGSGILSIAALKLGAREILGIDTDTEAISAAADNFRHNQLPVGATIGLVVGTVACVRGRFSLVTANLDRWLLQEIAHDVVGVVQHGGGLILSGFLCEETEEIRLLYESLGCNFYEARAKDGWAALFLTGGPQ